MKERTTEKKPLRKAARNIIIGAFLAVLFMPFLLSLLSTALDVPMDIELSGYTDKAPERKAFSLHAWTDGSYQTGFAAEWTNSFLPRGLLIKVYNTVNFYLFNKSLRIIGRNYDIFEADYINAELALTEIDDFSLPGNRENLQRYVEQLQVLQDLLQKRGKTLYVYVAASKGSAHRDNIPDKYLRASEYHTRAVDYYRELLDATDIPHLFCCDLTDELEYPAFYTTGIHWSRTYEQYASRRIVRDLMGLTGKNYRNLVFAGVEESRAPFDRDNDVFDLANVFFTPDVTYYQYRLAEDDGAPRDRMRILIQGDSFGLGLRKDLMENDADAEVYYVPRNETIVNREEQHTVFLGEWDMVDWVHYIDQVDIVALEATEALIRERSFGFVPMLIEKLQQEDAKENI